MELGHRISSSGCVGGYLNPFGGTVAYPVCSQATSLLHSVSDATQDDRGNSPLMLAAANNDPRIASLLLEAGADPFLRNAAGETAADIAENLGNQEVLAVLPRR
nr:hypothetical protein [Bacillota bacterium]